MPIENVIIKQASIEEVYALYLKIPDFKNPYTSEEFNERLKAPHLILVAYCENTPVGFKIGYATDKHEFYSWVGGTMPAYRNLRIASKLLIEQEKWAKYNHYNTIKVKTRNCFKNMLKLLVSHDYLITAIETRTSINQNRIIFKKIL